MDRWVKKPLYSQSTILLLRTLVTLGLTFFLFSLREFCPVGADGWYLAELVATGSDGFFYRSLLTVELHRWVYRVVQPWGLDSWNAIALSSALAGALAVQTLWALRRDGWFLALNIGTGAFLVFVGHVENYAWVNTFLLLSFYYAKAWIEGRWRAWPVALFYVLASLAHMLAVFYLPAFVYLFWRKRDYHPLELVLPALLFSLVLSLAPLFGTLLGTDNGLERLVPWFTTWAKNHYFTFASAAHLKMLAYFHQRAAYFGCLSLPFPIAGLETVWYDPVLYLGVPLELPLLVFLRRRIQGLYLRFLLVASLCGLAWTTIWHPDWGPMDWDLFSQFAIPLHLLLGLVLRPETRVSE